VRTRRCGKFEALVVILVYLAARCKSARAAEKEFFSPYIGEAEGEKAFGGKLLDLNNLEISITIK
jgi:hypothetical protein